MVANPEKTSRKERAYNRQVVEFVCALQRNLGLTRWDVQDAAGLDGREYDQFLALEKGLTISQFSTLARKYRFSLDAFEAGAVDFEALKRHHSGELSYLPEKYTRGGFSKKIMIINVLNYLDAHYAPALKYDLMDYFHIPESVHADREGSMNVIFFEDVMRYLRNRGLDDADVHAIGVHSAVTNHGTAFARRMGAFDTPRALFECYMTDLIRAVERNNFYTLEQLSNTHCEIESRDNPELQELFKVRNIGGPFRCAYRVGALSAATSYMGLPNSAVTETRCVHRGDRTCSFVIDYEIPTAHLKYRAVPCRKMEVA